MCQWVIQEIGNGPGATRMHPLIDFEQHLSTREIDFRVRLLIEHARSNLRGNLSLVELATRSNVCVGHLCRLFQLHLKMSPGRCIKLLRLSSAAKLLETTSLNVKEVMAAVGLNDESHFVRDFGAAIGESPARYRAKLRGRG
jgi:AraC family transcriptional regulator